MTGAASADLNAIKPHIEEIKGQTDIPVAIGFGIKTPEDAKNMGELADAVVVGSSIVNTIAESQDISKVSDQVKGLAGALK